MWESSWWCLSTDTWFPYPRVVASPHLCRSLLISVFMIFWWPSSPASWISWSLATLWSAAVVSGGGALHWDIVTWYQASWWVLHFKTFKTFRSLLVHLIKFDFSGHFHIGMKELRVIWNSINACCVAVVWQYQNHKNPIHRNLHEVQWSFITNEDDHSLMQLWFVIRSVRNHEWMNEIYQNIVKPWPQTLSPKP